MRCTDCYNCRVSIDNAGYVCVSQDIPLGLHDAHLDGADHCEAFDADLEYKRIGTQYRPRTTRDEQAKALRDVPAGFCRCRDCRYWKSDKYGAVRCGIYGNESMPNDYCHMGEARDGGANK